MRYIKGARRKGMGKRSWGKKKREGGKKADGGSPASADPDESDHPIPYSFLPLKTAVYTRSVPPTRKPGRKEKGRGRGVLKKKKKKKGKKEEKELQSYPCRCPSILQGRSLLNLFGVPAWNSYGATPGGKKEKRRKMSRGKKKKKGGRDA